MTELSKAIFLEAAFQEHARRKPNVGEAAPITDRAYWYRRVGQVLLYWANRHAAANERR